MEKSLRINFDQFSWGIVWYLICYYYEYISEHVKYIDQFCADFKSALEKMIINGITERKNTELTDALHLECVQHVQFAQERCKLFRGRKMFLEEIQQKVNEKQVRTFLKIVKY